MGWSTTAPSGVSWGTAKETNQFGKDNYYYYKLKAQVARGTNDTIYVKFVLIANQYAYGVTPPAASMRAEIRYSTGNSWTTSSYYTAAPSYGYDATVKTVYWTGTRASGAKIYVRAHKNSAGNADSGSLTFDAPAYTSTYSITYSANGGSGSMTNSSHVYGSSVSVKANGFTRTGYRFTGWKSSGTGTIYQPGASWNENTDRTFSAQWELLTYTVGYNGNSPDGETPVTNLPESGTKTYGVNYTISDTIPVCEGFSFNHWNTAADDSGTVVAPGGTLTGNQNYTLYAIWDGTYPITYDGNGATGGSTESQTKIEDQSVTIQQNGFTRDKHTFSHWNTAADGSGDSYDPDDTYTTNAPLYLYAIWLKNNIPVYYKDSNGTVHQVEKAYYKDSNGVVHEFTMYYKDSNGTVHEIA